MSSQTFVLAHRRSTTRLAHQLSAVVQPGDVLLLAGDLGAGKTFFSRAFLRAMGVPESIPVTSPTFTLMNVYPPEFGSRLTVVHADLYRLIGDEPTSEADSSSLAFEEEARSLGLGEWQGNGAVLLIEWGALALRLFQNEALLLSFTRTGTHSREVTIHAHGAWAQNRLSLLRE